MSLAKRALELPESNGLRKQVIEFLGGEKLGKAIYTGKSKKVTSKEVFVISQSKDKSKIRDLKGNETTVTTSQLKF